MLAIAIRDLNEEYSEDNSLQMVLPTYDDALKSMPTTPPPTFEEAQEELLSGKHMLWFILFVLVYWHANLLKGFVL